MLLGTLLILFNLSQEEESPEGGDLRRAESSPTPLKRDRSFSEHDLALLRGEMLPSFSESDQLEAAARLRSERPRSRTLSGARPPPHYRGQQAPAIVCFNVLVF